MVRCFVENVLRRLENKHFVLQINNKTGGNIIWN